MYSSVLLANNMHFVTWFKYTEYMALPVKLIIVFVVMYIYFFYLPRIMINKENEITKSIAIGMAYATKEAFVYNKVLSLFMLISWHYAHYIDETHRSFLTKYTGKTAPFDYTDDLPSFLLRLGILPGSILKMKQYLPDPFMAVFQIQASHREIIWKYDKNYFFPLLVNMNSVSYSAAVLSNYPKIMVHYELLKHLNGDMCVQQGLGEAIQEYEDFIFILRVWRYYVRSYWDIATIYNSGEHVLSDFLCSEINSNGMYYADISRWSTVRSLSYCLPFGNTVQEHVPGLLTDILVKLPEYDFSIDNFKSYLLKNKEDLNTPLNQLRVGFYAKKPAIITRFCRLDFKVQAHCDYLDHSWNKGTAIQEHFDKLLAAHKAKHCVYKPSDTRAFLSKLRDK
jgi:hypothetical protein